MPIAPRTSLLLLLAVLVVGGGIWAYYAFRGDGEGAAPSRTILVTGFGPFGGYETNPAWESVRELEGAVIGKTRIRTARLDVTYGMAESQLDEAIRGTGADMVLCLGVAPDDQLRIETTARNQDATAFPDNAGVVRNGETIREDGPETIPTQLPVDRLLERLGAEGFEVRTSDDAGGYLCNHVFYCLMDGLAPPQASGFIHVPTLGRSWDLERLKRAVRVILEVLDEEVSAPVS
ncbi:MAG: pyroglutamyl-peptidase I [Planctomycetota bacterium]|jgi:pyroglutamyl-peptidase